MMRFSTFYIILNTQPVTYVISFITDELCCLEDKSTNIPTPPPATPTDEVSEEEGASGGTPRGDAMGGDRGDAKPDDEASNVAPNVVSNVAPTQMASELASDNMASSNLAAVTEAEAVVRLPMPMPTCTPEQAEFALVLRAFKALKPNPDVRVKNNPDFGVDILASNETEV